MYDIQPVTGALDFAQIMGDSLATFVPNMMGILGVVAPLVMSVVVAQVGIAWGIRLFRNITGR